MFAFGFFRGFLGGAGSTPAMENTPGRDSHIQTSIFKIAPVVFRFKKVGDVLPDSHSPVPLSGAD